MIVFAVLFFLVATITAFAQGWNYRPTSKYIGKIDIIMVPHHEVLRRCGYQHRPNVRGCTFGGVKGFGGVRGKCIIILDETRPQYLEHELAHCAGWEHD